MIYRNKKGSSSSNIYLINYSFAYSSVEKTETGEESIKQFCESFLAPFVSQFLDDQGLKGENSGSSFPLWQWY